MKTSELVVHRGHVIGVLMANAILWAAVLLVAEKLPLGGAGAIALISIASLFIRRPRAA